MNINTPLQIRLFNIVVIATALLSSFSILGNLLFSYDVSFAVNLKWILLILICAIYAITQHFSYDNQLIKLLFILTIIFIILPYGWVESGGSSNNAIAYAFLIMICITFLYSGPIRSILVGCLIVVFILMLMVEYTYPEIIKVYDTQTQFWDRIIQIPLTLSTGFCIVGLFANEYIKDNKKLQVQSIKMEELSLKDSLTQAYNRRGFDQYMEACLSEEQDISLILIDIDKFKIINDSFGHAVGDKALIYIVEVLRSVFSDTSHISRWGGDEFAIVTFIHGQDLIDCINNTNILLSKISFSQPFILSVSSGVTRIRPQDTLDSVLQRADSLLYKAKEQGKASAKID